ncbi:RICIN domain-containing protein [Actinoplanes siamensis]|uniref:Ricin B lectin domain-containing protein n=1 Tax=Actinoplanes siamensis TaxID=1223317 RepID=A0A919N5R9_9ACTN|nr:ricin-type beta-trefoil lectin domain protein [Actinoplanes siamensis]GIF04829.1 hypothetical protein Asi03nite_23670 [Actinoplanes siamensis]
MRQMFAARARKVTTTAVAAVVMSTGLPAVTTTPANAALIHFFIQNIATADCLDQHFDPNAAPTTTVYSWPNPCHYLGNQQWRFVSVGGNDYKVVNQRSEWCLSQPAWNGRVYAEICVSPTPAKQKWGPSPVEPGANFLVNRNTSQCLQQEGNPDVYGRNCDPTNNSQLWQWRERPA